MREIDSLEGLLIKDDSFVHQNDTKVCVSLVVKLVSWLTVRRGWPSLPCLMVSAERFCMLEGLVVEG